MIALGKFLDSYRQLKRANKKIKGRRFYVDAFPWYDGEASEITVTDAKDLHSDKKYVAEINEVGSGYSVGLMFELAGKQLIKEIKCPKCGKIAPLNVHWQGFQCDDAIWEMLKQMPLAGVKP